YADRTGRLPPEIGGLNFQGLNRNKRGLTIDIGQEAGAALVRRLVAQSDVLVENFRPGVMERHGLGYETLRAANPRLVYCSITAFRPRGPQGVIERSAEHTPELQSRGHLLCRHLLEKKKRGHAAAHPRIGDVIP